MDNDTFDEIASLVYDRIRKLSDEWMQGDLSSEDYLDALQEELNHIGESN
jgi:hypothetical protein